MKRTLFTAATLALASGFAASALAGEPVEVTASGPQGDLAGTLIPPAEGQPVVVIIPGSGPTDRDGNNPLGITAASYRLLGEKLAERGIGSLRIDKRGMFASKAAIADPNAVSIADYATDVRAWVAVAKERTGAPCVWVMGHSEGGLVALEAAQLPDDICGILLVASVGRPLGVTLREQLQANPANAFLLDQAFGALNALEAGQRVDASALHPGLRQLFAPEAQGFLIDMLARDPAAMAAKVQIPVLIVAGGKDIQTPVADGMAIANGQPAAEFTVIPDMNHVLKAVEGDDRASNLAVYSDPAKPIHPDLVAAIADFVTQTGGAEDER